MFPKCAAGCETTAEESGTDGHSVGEAVILRFSIDREHGSQWHWSVSPRANYMSQSALWLGHTHSWSWDVRRQPAFARDECVPGGSVKRVTALWEGETERSRAGVSRSVVKRW